MTILFDAVLFDLDGTLVATERFWVAAATRGTQRALAELGLERPLPAPAEWLSMVGLPLEQGFEQVFGDLTPAQRRRVMALCVEEEHAALRAGGAAPMPGAFEVLRELRQAGVRVGIASNCSHEYLRTMLDDLGLGAFTEQARCLESPGIATKADMLRDLLASFGTRSAVMVGDRAGDAEAARANAIPHVHLRSGLAPVAERVEADATIDGLHQLLPLLGARARAIEATLEALGASARVERGPTLGVTGRSAAGKTLFARDAVRLLERLERPAAALSLDAFLTDRARVSTVADGPLDDHLARAFDLPRLFEAVLEPRARGAPTAAGRWGSSVPPQATMLLEGLFLLDPRIRSRLDGLVYLQVDPATALARLRARDAPRAALERFERDFLPAQIAFEARYPPAQADRTLDGARPLWG